jgi:hypothetical protein
MHISILIILKILIKENDMKKDIKTCTNCGNELECCIIVNYDDVDMSTVLNCIKSEDFSDLYIKETIEKDTLIIKCSCGKPSISKELKNKIFDYFKII